MISIISDVHIKKPGDDSFDLFLRFLKNEKVKGSQKIILLGDIFDLLVGGDESFFVEFRVLFDEIRLLMDSGVEIFYLEGNHDFHIENFMNKFLGHKNFFFSKDYISLNHLGKKVIFSHGDDIEIENPSYKIYSSLIRSFPIKVLAERMVPFSFTKSIGDWASARSRKKNIKKYEEKVDDIKDKFRRSAETLYEKEVFDLLVTGHSHVKDKYESKSGFTYLNNGYAPMERTFIYLTEEQEFIKLS